MSGRISGLTVIAIGATVLTIALLFRRDDEQPLTAPPPRVETRHRDSEAEQAPAERPVAFSQSMPKGPGTQLVNSRGDLNLALVQVAVPDRFGKVEFLPGSDPRAIQYLAEVREAQQGMVLDKGPKEVEVDKIPSRMPTSGRGARMMKITASP